MWYRIWCQLFYCMSPKNLHKYFKFSVDKLQLMLYDIKCVWQTWPTQQSMREWLSWWSTTLPRSGPRVRVPSRALLLHEKGASKRMPLFSCKKSPKGSSQWHELKFIPGSRSQPTAIKPDRFYQLISSRRIDACASTASARLVAITWSGLRSAQNRGPPDLVRRLALLFFTRKGASKRMLFFAS